MRGISHVLICSWSLIKAQTWFCLCAFVCGCFPAPQDRDIYCVNQPSVTIRKYLRQMCIWVHSLGGSIHVCLVLLLWVCSEVKHYGGNTHEGAKPLTSWPKGKGELGCVSLTFPQPPNGAELGAGLSYRGLLGHSRSKPCITCIWPFTGWFDNIYFVIWALPPHCLSRKPPLYIHLSTLSVGNMARSMLKTIESPHLANKHVTVLFPSLWPSENSSSPCNL